MVLCKNTVMLKNRYVAPCIYVGSPRQVGKTTLANKIAASSVPVHRFSW
jgi:predicted AAA+ superfamily ATPase